MLGNFELDQIYTGDARELAKGIPDAGVDLVITSPPYDELRAYKGFVFDFPGIAAQLWRIVAVGGVLVWVVNDETNNGSETGSSFRQVLTFQDLGFNIHDTMIYEKNGAPYPDQTRYYQTFEFMFVLSKGKPKTINLIRDRKNKYLEPWGNRSKREKDGTLTAAGTYKGDEFGVRFNIWRINTGLGFSASDKFAHQHPAIFPEELAKDHILTWSNPGDIILDPMCGSGTTCKMAKQQGRRWLGFDISPEYCELARRRIAETQPPLFVLEHQQAELFEDAV